MLSNLSSHQQCKPVLCNRNLVQFVALQQTTNLYSEAKCSANEMRQVQSLAGGAPAVCQPLLLFTRVCTVDTVHCECAVIDSVTLVSVLCEHCVQPKHPLLFRRGTLDYLPLAGSSRGHWTTTLPAAFAYLTLQGPTRGIGPWTLDFNAGLANVVAS